MCKTCVDAALDAAFTNGFSPEPKKVTGEELTVLPAFEDLSLLDLEYDEDE